MVAGCLSMKEPPGARSPYSAIPVLQMQPMISSRASPVKSKVEGASPVKRTPTGQYPPLPEREAPAAQRVVAGEGGGVQSARGGGGGPIFARRTVPSHSTNHPLFRKRHFVITRGQPLIATSHPK